MHGQTRFKFLDRFSKKSQISSSIKIRPVEAELFHQDRQTDGADTTKQIIAFHNFADAPKNDLKCCVPNTLQ